MKKFLVMLVLACGPMWAPDMRSQDVNINIQVGSSLPAGWVRPAWLGTAAWDAPYVYLPEVDVYYSLAEGFYYYMSGGRWCCSLSLPPVCRGYDLAALRHIAIRTPRPWQHHARHRALYCRREPARPPRRPAVAGRVPAVKPRPAAPSRPAVSPRPGAGRPSAPKPGRGGAEAGKNAPFVRGVAQGKDNGRGAGRASAPKKKEQKREAASRTRRF